MRRCFGFLALNFHDEKEKKNYLANFIGIQAKNM